MSEIISARVIERLTKIFVKHLSAVAKRFGVPEEDIFVSDVELSSALREAARDLNAIQARRNVGAKGLSIGKIAGALCFRLNRYRIVNICPQDLPAPRDGTDIARQRAAYKIQDVAIICLLFEHLLHRSVGDATLRELLYVFSRRHINQEMLGVVFDAMNVPASL